MSPARAQAPNHGGRMWRWCGPRGGWDVWARTGAGDGPGHKWRHACPSGTEQLAEFASHALHRWAYFKNVLSNLVLNVLRSAASVRRSEKNICAPDLKSR